MKSSFCGADGCVEVSTEILGYAGAEDTDIDVLVSDSKDPDGPVLRFTTNEWQAFIKGVKAGEFDF